MDKNKNVLLGLPEIAAWQIDAISNVNKSTLIASLPSIQRGAVWKVRQTEELWDSIFRGFPIGSFLLSPYDKSRGIQEFKLQEKVSDNPTHHLLDGQQRATGIALGFFNPWNKECPNKLIKSVLWLDLASSPKGRDIEFVFRVLTRAHPWGYLRSDPNDTISTHQVRLALHAFKLADSSLMNHRPSEIPLTKVWPWDSEAPIPVPFIIDAILLGKGDSVKEKETLRKLLNTLSFMRKIDDTADATSSNAWLKQQSNVQTMLNDPNSVLAQRLDQVFIQFKERLNEFKVPSMILPFVGDSSTACDSGTKDDAIETLFIRVNSSGTPLEGEELMYSLIKSAWKEAPEYIGKLTHHLATPARTALLASRIVLAQNQRGKGAKHTKVGAYSLVPVLTVAEFRRRIRGLNKESPEFFSNLQIFIKGDGLKVFDQARIFLTHDDFGLPPVLASELAQKSQDIFFLFLCWLDLLGQAGINPMSLSKLKRSRTIGFLTALAWFAKDKTKAISSIWDDLQMCENKYLPDFFGKSHFKKTCQLDGRNKLRMVPIPTPDDLHKTLQKKVLGYQGCQGSINKIDSVIWTKWNWWEWLIEKEKRPKGVDEFITPLLNSEDTKDVEILKERTQDAWNHFMEKQYGNRSMLLYVQRNEMKEWFPDFDPSLPEFLEDKNRPWDYDHIHPQRYMRTDNNTSLRNIPELIRDWHSSIGNFRAWPLEANRSDCDAAPMVKLNGVSDEEKLYGLKSGKGKRIASFINEEDWKKYWEICIPEGEDREDRRYLADGKKYHKERKALVTAIVRRFVGIYRNWYETLKIDRLVG